MPRLLRFIIMNALDSPLTSGGVKRRVSSPSGKRSTLITSAPMSASSMPAVGPDMMCATSMTLSPASGPIFSHQSPRKRGSRLARNACSPSRKSAVSKQA